MGFVNQMSRLVEFMDLGLLSRYHNYWLQRYGQ